MISRLIEALTDGISSSYVAQLLKELEAQAATDKATIETLQSVPAQAPVLPYPALPVQGALNLQ
jgi:hypothetical protein